jgi:CO/xanthine dehydrogenase Mo-binding subunit
MRKQAATAKDGRVQQTNFYTYQMLRMNEAPAIEVHIVQNFEPPGGMGECGTSAIVPAVANAIVTVQPGAETTGCPKRTAAAELRRCSWRA